MMSREESDTTEHVHALEKEIATHPSALAQGRGSLVAFRLLQSNTTEAAACTRFNTASLSERFNLDGFYIPGATRQNLK